MSDENNTVATFVIFDREGVHFAGKRASEVFASEFPEVEFMPIIYLPKKFIELNLIIIHFILFLPG